MVRHLGQCLLNEWMNEWMMHLYSAFCVLLYTQSTLQSCGGGLSSTTTRFSSISSISSLRNTNRTAFNMINVLNDETQIYHYIFHLKSLVPVLGSDWSIVLKQCCYRLIGFLIFVLHLLFAYSFMNNAKRWTKIWQIHFLKILHLDQIQINDQNLDAVDHFLQHPQSLHGLIPCAGLSYHLATLLNFDLYAAYCLMIALFYICICLHKHTIACFCLFWSRCSILFQKMGNSASYHTPVKTRKVLKILSLAGKELIMNCLNHSL